ncbi:hypothetical protein [Flavobacterium sp. N1994]|uniref:hypothetical protein n=1 Tax=Flavobacterium sp. N1994 TaxID=2986827 RepID=UPI00222267A3|nr:hypothetical protein [Flavobacterium sp. N1994]
MDYKRISKILGGAAIGVVAVAAVPFTGGGSLLAGAAALGLGTTTALVSAGVAGVIGGAIAGGSFKNNKRIGLGIFGMQNSGKTTIFNFLRNENEGPGTSIRDLSEIEFKLENGKRLYIKKGVDIGGGEEFIKKNYGPMLLDNNYDVYFFVFNSFEYLNKTNEQRDVDARIDFIKKKNNNKMKIILIGSHFDKFKINESIVRNEIKEKVKDKVYSDLFNENLVLIDLTNNVDLQDFINTKAFK